MPKRIEWTDEHITSLKALHAQGLSCSMIAARMGEGRTRNSVIGKISRLDLNNGNFPRRAPSMPVLRKAPEARKDSYTPEEIALLSTGLSDRQIGEKIGRSAKSVHNKRCKLGLHRTARERMPHSPNGKTRIYGGLVTVAARRDAPIEPPPEPRGDKPTLMQLKARDCRYPYGDPRHSEFAFCGRPVQREGASYCDAHAAICFQPLVRR